MVPGCGFIQKLSILENKNSQSTYKPVTWVEAKTGLMTAQPTDEALNLLHKASLKEDEIDEALSLYKSTKDDRLRLEIFNKLSVFIKTNSKVLDLYKKVASSQDRMLAPIALKLVLNTELTPDEFGNDQWTNWQWSQDVKKILEESVEKSMYKLSGFEYKFLLVLANRYPASKFTQGAKEYRTLIGGGKFYFGYRDSLPNGQESPVLRQPFVPQKEVNIWSRFFQKYPDHPGTDDAMYRIARSYEIKKDYENAILWYYKASQAPDGDLSDLAKGRTLFLIDSVMSSNSLNKFISANSHHPLIPYLTYSKAVYLIREEKILEAQSEIEKFVRNYKNLKLTRFFDGSEGKYMSSSLFWSNVEQQIDSLKKLNKIRSLPLTDNKLYEEGSFWFYNDLTAYNYLWHGLYIPTFFRSMPEKWEGINTVVQRSINFELVQSANQSYKFQNGSLKSINLFQKLLKEYPNSALKEKAQYSIALAYYYLTNEKWPNLSDTDISWLSDTDISWRNMAVKNFYDFVNRFPKSSLADDALLSIAYVTGVDKAIALQALERLLNEYPNGDRKKDAQERIEALRGQIPKNHSSSSQSGVGINMDSEHKGTGVLILYTVRDSPASKAGLQGGDIIIQVDGQNVSSVDEVKNIIQRHRVGETIFFEIEREGRKKAVAVRVEML